MVWVPLPAFALAIYLFIRFIIKRDHGHKEPLGALFGAVGFGLLAVFLASLANNLLVPDRIADGVATGTLHSLPISTLLPAAIGIGIIEESLKCLPLAFFIYKKRYFDELTDGVIYFGIVGLTFGIIEDIEYTISYGPTVGVVRILISPYLHAAFAVLFGICLVQRRVLKRSWLLVAGGLLAAIAAHAAFDFTAFVGGWALWVMLAITFGLNVLLFVIFRKAQKADERRGASATGMNKFCRQCGKPNPERLLYCTFCGELS